MYEAFYGFREKPFNLTPDPKYLYLSAEQSEIPELKKVIAVYKSNVVMADTLEQAVSMAISGDLPPTPPPTGDTLQQLVAEYFGHLDAAETYRAQGNYVDYGRELAAASEVRARIEALLAGEAT